MVASRCIVLRTSGSTFRPLSSAAKELAYPVTSSTNASLCRWWWSLFSGQQKWTPRLNLVIQSSSSEETNTHVGGPARLPCP